MALLIVALAVVLLLVMMTRFKINGFIALFIAAVFVGVARGMPLDKIYDAILDGVGGQLDELILILGFGAMLGKILADSGAAQRIATTLVNTFGIGRVQLVMVLTATCIGITMFYEVGFVLLIPLVFTIVREYRLPLLWVGLPMSMTLSTMHSFLPPHPGPATVTDTFHASQGITLLYGLPIAIVSASIICYVWPRLPFVKRITPAVPVSLITERQFTEKDLPSFGACVGIVLSPVVLMAIAAGAELGMDDKNAALPYIQFFGEAPVALLIALLLAVVFLGPKIGHMSDEQGPDDAAPAAGGGTTTAVRQGRFQAAMNSCAQAVKPMAMITMVIAGGGAFKEVLVASGIADYIGTITHGWTISPIILAWLIALLLRVAIGSATVTVVTAAGIVLPLVQGSGTAPELMVLAVTCGSIAASHVNDPGFWLFKEYLNLSVTETLKVRTTYTSALSVLGLGGVLAMSAIVG